MDISSWALIISFFILVGSIPFTIYLYREILKLTQEKNSSSYLLAGYGGLLLINIGIGTFLVTNILSMEVDYGGMFIGLGGLGLFVVIAYVVILLAIASLAESTTTLYFLKKYSKPTLLEISFVWVIILSLSLPLLYMFSFWL